MKIINAKSEIVRYNSKNCSDIINKDFYLSANCICQTEDGLSLTINEEGNKIKSVSPVLIWSRKNFIKAFVSNADAKAFLLLADNVTEVCTDEEEMFKQPMYLRCKRHKKVLLKDGMILHYSYEEF